MRILSTNECRRKQKEVKEQYGDEYKYCNYCGEIKNIDNFAKNGNGYRSSKCKNSNKEYKR